MADTRGEDLIDWLLRYGFFAYLNLDCVCGVQGDTEDYSDGQERARHCFVNIKVLEAVLRPSEVRQK